MISICEKSNPAIQFNLEMITRDPLRIPCLSRKYWATLGNVPATRLARTLALVKERRSPVPLPSITGKSPAEVLAEEDGNVRQSLAYAAARLGLG
jgi:hypothetical protein